MAFVDRNHSLRAFAHFFAKYIMSGEGGRDLARAAEGSGFDPAYVGKLKTGDLAAWWHLLSDVINVGVPADIFEELKSLEFFPFKNCLFLLMEGEGVKGDVAAFLRQGCGDAEFIFEQGGRRFYVVPKR